MRSTFVYRPVLAWSCWHVYLVIAHADLLGILTGIAKLVQFCLHLLQLCNDLNDPVFGLAQHNETDGEYLYGADGYLMLNTTLGYSCVQGV